MTRLQKTRRSSRPLRVLDIAAGHGRYVLDALGRAARQPEAIVLRDFCDINVRDGAALIRARGLATLVLLASRG